MVANNVSYFLKEKEKGKGPWCQVCLGLSTVKPSLYECREQKETAKQCGRNGIDLKLKQLPEWNSQTKRLMRVELPSLTSSGLFYGHV